MQLVFEQGMLSRVRMLCDDAKTREAGVRVLGAMVRSPVLLHRRIVLSSKFVGALNLMLTELDSVDDSEVTRKEMCAALLAVMETDPKYMQRLLALGFLDRLSALIETNVFETTVQAGKCLAYIVLNCDPSDMAAVALRSFPRLQQLLALTDTVVLSQTLLAISRVAEWAVSAHATIPGTDVRERINLLTSHPISRISELAEAAEEGLSRCEEDGV